MILDKLDMTQKLDRDDYKKQLPELQVKLRDLEFKMYKKRIPAVIVYQGWDAAGKGGSIKRLTAQLDPRGYRVIGIKAPTQEEKNHHYLWRFWNQVPKAGHLTIFDRSWYGRVLVERIEGFCSQREWERAYQEINEFEQNLHNYGTVIVKFWVHITKEEQYRRFKERETNPFKRWKLTDEDWRNREKWDLYQDAVEEMLRRTSTLYAPWTIIEGNDKPFARVKALATTVSAIENRLKQ